MDAVATILTSPYTIPVLCFLAFVILLGVILVKSGILSFRGKGLVIGVESKERSILQRQTTYVHTQIDAIASRILHDHPEFDKYHTYWVCKCVEIEWIRAIHYNSIHNTDGYIDDRLTQIRAIVQKKSENDFFFSKEFDEFLKEHVKETVIKLENIRRLEQ